MLTPTYDIDLQEKGLTLRCNGEAHYINYYWLRDNCPTSFDPKLRERTFDITQLSAPPRAAAAEVRDGALQVSWAGETHRSAFPLDSLLAFVSSRQRADPASLPRNLWRQGQAENFQRFSQRDVMTDLATCRAWAKAVITDGIAVITEMEDSDQALTDLAERLGLVHPSVSGTYFEVKVHIDPVNLAFTANALEMHTDTPAEELAPGVQFLHCRQNTVDGGHSLFVDGAAVAEDFRRE
ncbi:MAG: TauD/TfdA family dioxygenase, partial [Pseudomonadota bacterium]